MEGFEIELKHGIVLVYHGKPLYHLGNLLEEIRLHVTQRRTANVYGNSSGYTVRLGRNPADPPPTGPEWLEMVNELAPVVDDIKRRRLGTKALYDALVSGNTGVSHLADKSPQGSITGAEHGSSLFTDDRPSLPVIGSDRG